MIAGGRDGLDDVLGALGADEGMFSRRRRSREENARFAEFLAATSDHWDRLAKKVERFWELPSWLDAEDLRQEILIAVWTTVSRFDPSRGKSINEYVIFQAFDRAKKCAHKARLGKRVHRGEASAPSRFDLPFTRIAVDRHDGGEPDASGEPALAWMGKVVVPRSEGEAADERFDRERAYARAMGVCGTVREILSVQAMNLACGSIDGAALALYEDRDARRLCQLGSEEEARRVVRRAMMLVAERVARVEDRTARRRAVRGMIE